MIENPLGKSSSKKGQKERSLRIYSKTKQSTGETYKISSQLTASKLGRSPADDGPAHVKLKRLFLHGHDDQLGWKFLPLM